MTRLYPCLAFAMLFVSLFVSVSRVALLWSFVLKILVMINFRVRNRGPALFS